MDTALKQEVFERFALVWSGVEGQEFSGEAIVPDAMPDVGSVVDAQGVLYVRGKDTTAGRVHLSAAASVAVLFEPAEGGPLRSVELSVPADFTLDAPGAEEEDRITARLRLCSVEARALNSRKLAVRIEAEAEIGCWRRESTELAVDLRENDGSAHIRQSSAELLAVSDVREKTFVVTDECPVPPGKGTAERILAKRTDAVVEEVKYVSGKVIFRGRVRSSLVLACDGGEAIPVSFETEFSQIMEVDVDAEDAAASAALLLTGAYFDLPEFGDGAGRIAAELHFAAQCVCRARRTLHCLADIYSNRTALVPSFSELTVETEARPVTMRQTVAGRTEPEVEGGELLLSSAAVGAILLEEDAVKTSVNVRLVFQKPEGGYAVSRCRLTAEFTLPAREDTRLESVSVSVADVYVTGADVRVALQMDAIAVTEGTIRSVSDVTEDAEAFQSATRRPSAVLVRVPAGCDLWGIAKRYGSTEEEIALANGGRTEGLLLIPKSR